MGDFRGSVNSDLSAHRYDEYTRLSKKIKLIILARKIGQDCPENVRVIIIPPVSKPFWILKDLIVYTKTLVKYRKEFDIVFARVLTYHSLVPAIIAKIFFKKKLVVWIASEAHAIKNKENRFYRPIIKISLKLADKIGAFSEDQFNVFEKHIGHINKNKVFYQNRDIDVAVFKPNGNVSDNIILNVGRIIPIKGIKFLIKAIPLVVEKIPDIKLKVVGRIEDQNYYQEVKKLISELKVKDFVDFVGPVPHNTIVNYYKSSKIFVNTSRAVGVSSAIVEAMACGLPVVSTSKGSIPYLERYKYNGFKVKENPLSIAQKIILLLKDESLREKVSKASRRTILENFEGNVFVDKLYSIFKELIEDELSNKS